MLTLLAVPALAAVVTAGSAGPAGAADRCRPTSGRVLERTAHAVVYGSRKGPVTGCWRSSGRRTRLMSRADELDARSLAYLKVQGRFAAVEAVTAGRRGEEYSLRVVDLRRGRSVHTTTPFIEDLPAESEGVYRSVTQLLLAPNGDATWIARGFGSATGGLQVYKVDRDGLTRLDPGPDVEAGSLALSRRRDVYWTSAGTARSARLAPAG